MAAKRSKTGGKRKSVSTECNKCHTKQKADTPKSCACKYKVGTVRPSKKTSSKKQYIVKLVNGKRAWRLYSGKTTQSKRNYKKSKRSTTNIGKRSRKTKTSSLLTAAEAKRFETIRKKYQKSDAKAKIDLSEYLKMDKQKEKKQITQMKKDAKIIEKLLKKLEKHFQLRIDAIRYSAEQMPDLIWKIKYQGKNVEITNEQLRGAMKAENPNKYKIVVNYWVDNLSYQDLNKLYQDFVGFISSSASKILNPPTDSTRKLSFYTKAKSSFQQNLETATNIKIRSTESKKTKN